ncbi:uncharacterized protein V1518DRAFT_298453 [Limtongia smithiae]|uniref:uncharacterized protein n=1 Tax=Limtongia smithiae TaxID=1125753 RepID=UPI0034CD2337
MGSGSQFWIIFLSLGVACSRFSGIKGATSENAVFGHVKEMRLRADGGLVWQWTTGGYGEGKGALVLFDRSRNLTYSLKLIWSFRRRSQHRHWLHRICAVMSFTRTFAKSSDQVQRSFELLSKRLQRAIYITQVIYIMINSSQNATSFLLHLLLSRTNAKN